MSVKTNKKGLWVFVIDLNAGVNSDNFLKISIPERDIPKFEITAVVTILELLARFATAYFDIPFWGWKMKKKMMVMGKVLQKHHISYEPEVTVLITKGEHQLLGRLDWYTRKFISAGFIKALKVFIALNEDRAVDLEGVTEDGKKDKI